jgi:hypothetical protein
LAQWSESRPEELASVLLTLLDDPSPVLRRGAAKLIAASAMQADPWGGRRARVRLDLAHSAVC